MQCQVNFIVENYSYHGAIFMTDQSRFPLIALSMYLSLS